MDMKYWRAAAYDGSECVGVIDFFDNERAAEECRDWHQMRPKLGFDMYNIVAELVVLPKLKSSFVPPMSEEEYSEGPGKEMQEHYAWLERQRNPYGD